VIQASIVRLNRSYPGGLHKQFRPPLRQDQVLFVILSIFCEGSSS
jgi:hypothetical protein